MIIEMTRGHVRLRVGERTVTIQGEAFLPGYGSPSFVAYRNSVNSWDPPLEDVGLSESERDQVLEELRRCLSEKGLSLEVE